ncbi:asparaginase [Aquimarina sp. U1-2]|uniref:asparaginase domain-containing protein n=1 Tax=Aquimarina sp. U1-2 TaxID=2823141 RepID=UPI001AED0D9F|nr:asparaginase domain-containing protein [Aquimarina sp. U1-2]MBP2833742.1 asparaginase [Aquimarina sp. U1-2]
MIQIITTGGTIEGLEYEDSINAPKESPLLLTTLLNQIKDVPGFTIQKAFLKDSRFIDKEDRKFLAELVTSTESSKVLITHGTLTMVETAKYLGKLDIDKTIVLTGSFILGTLPNSDVLDNLKFAILNLTDLSKGVYIAMHHQIFNWYKVRKNIEQDRFEDY